MSTTIQSISESKLKARWREPYFTGALNTIMSALPEGVVRGFVPSFGGFGMNLRLLAEDGISMLRVRSAGGQYTVTYVETATLDLDLSAVAGTTVYIGAAASYTEGAATTASISAYTEAEYAANPLGVCWIAKVQVPALPGPITSSMVDLAPRSWIWIPQDDDYNVEMHDVAVDGDFYHPHWWQRVSGSGNAAFQIQSGTTSQSPNACRLYLSGATTGNDDITVSSAEWFAVSPGDIILVKFRARTTGAFSATDVGIRIEFGSATFGSIGSAVIKPLAAGVQISGAVGWAEYTGTATVPASARLAVVGVQVNNLAAGEFFIEGIRVYSQSSSKARVGDISRGHGGRPSDTPWVRHYNADNIGHQKLDAYMVLDVDSTGEAGLVWKPVNTNATYGASFFQWQVGDTGREVRVALKGDLVAVGNVQASGTGTFTAGVSAPGGIATTGGGITSAGAITGSTLETSGSQYANGSAVRRWGTAASPDNRYIYIHALVEDSGVQTPAPRATIQPETVAVNGFERKVATFSGIAQGYGFGFWVPPGAYVEEVYILCTDTDLPIPGTEFTWEIREGFSASVNPNGSGGGPAVAAYASGIANAPLRVSQIGLPAFQPSASDAKYVIFLMASTAFPGAASRDVLGIRVKLRVASIEGALDIRTS